MTEQPTTAAGRALLAHFRSDVARHRKDYPVHWLDAADIRKIEAEARQPGVLALRQRIEDEPFFPNNDGPTHGNAAAFRDYRNRILALAALPPNAPPARWQDATTDEWDAAANAHRDRIRGKDR